jgi:hypothetical protein
VALAETGPARTDDVLVEPLAGAKAENEAATAQYRQCRRALGDDRRVVSA